MVQKKKKKKKKKAINIWDIKVDNIVISNSR